MTEEAPPVGMRGRAFRAATWLFSGKLIQSFMRLGVLATLSRLLEPEEFGLVSAAMVIITFFRFFVRNGISPAVVQRDRITDLHERVAFTLSVALGCLMGALLFMSAETVGAFTFGLDGIGDVLSAIAILLPIQGLGVVSVALLERRLAFSTIVKVEFVSYLAYGSVGIGLAAAGYGVWSLVFAYVAESVVRTTVSLLTVRHSLKPSVDPACTRELVFYGSGFGIAGLGNFVAGNGDNWVVGRFLGGDALGFYKYAYELTATLSNLLGGILDKVFFPALARYQHDRVQVANAYQSGVSLIAIVLLPVSGALVVVAPELILLALGDGWDGVVTPFRILALVLVFRGTYKMADSVTRAMGAVYSRAWRQWIFAACVVGLGLLGSRWALAGVAGATAVSILVNSALMSALTARVAGLRWKEIIAAHAGPLPCLASSVLIAYAVLGAAQGLSLANASSVLLVILAEAVLLPLLIVAMPTAMTGRFGVRAISELCAEFVRMFPMLTRLPGIRWVLVERFQSHRAA